MTVKIVAMNQKGGVGKSTVARLVAVTAAKDGERVLLADLDTAQNTCVVWHTNRNKAGREPVIDVRAFDSYAKAVMAAKNENVAVLVVDTRGYTDAQSPQIAKDADLVVVPTGASEDDRHTTVVALNNLVKHGVDRKRIIVMVMTETSPSTVIDTYRYFEMAGFDLLSARWAPDSAKPKKLEDLYHIKRNTTYQNAHGAGLAICEVAHLGLRREAMAFSDAIATKLEGLL